MSYQFQDHTLLRRILSKFPKKRRWRLKLKLLQFHPFLLFLSNPLQLFQLQLPFRIKLSPLMKPQLPERHKQRQLSNNWSTHYASRSNLMRNSETTRSGSPFPTKLTNGRSCRPNFRRKTYKYPHNNAGFCSNRLWKSITLSSDGMGQHSTQEFSC